MTSSSEEAGESITRNRRHCNVLLCGHKDAGKSTAKKKIIELSMCPSRSVRVESSGDLESIVDKNDKRLVEGTSVKFQGAKYNTKTSTYEFVEAPSHHHYVPRMMSRALQADIAVLFVSGARHGIKDKLRDLQSKECIEMVMGLRINKILLVITRMDESTRIRFWELKKHMVNVLEQLGFRKDIQCIPVSFKDEVNIYSATEDDCPSFFDALDAFVVPSYDKSTRFGVDESDFIKSLVRVDLLLDKNPLEAASWNERAVLLEKISNKSKYPASDVVKRVPFQTLMAMHQVEETNISNYMASLEAAENAAKFGFSLSKKEEDIAVSDLVLGFQCRAANKLDAAYAYFESAMYLITKKTKPMNEAIIKLKNICKELKESKEKSSTPTLKKDVDVVRPREKEIDQVSAVSRENVAVLKAKKNTTKNCKGDTIEDTTSAPAVDEVKLCEQEKEQASAVSGERVVVVKTKKKKARNSKADTIKDTTSVVSVEEVPVLDVVEQEKKLAKNNEDDTVKDTSVVSSEEVTEKKMISGSPRGSTLTQIVTFTEYQVEITEDPRSIYDGSKIMNGIKMPCSFIACSEFQSKNYESLVFLGLNDVHILSVNDIVSVDGKKFFVGQSVKAVDTFFFELKSQRRVDDEDVCRWWSYIESKFRKIYRDVVDTLLYVYSKTHHGCGNLFGVIHNSLYITHDEEVRILPSMDINSTIYKDISDLVKQMKGIINLPRGGGDSLNLSELPTDISHMLSFLKPVKLNNVPSSWLLDHYFLWKPEECYNFIFNVRDLMKRLRSDYRASFDSLLDGEMLRDNSWANNIPPQTVYHEIYKKGSPDRPRLSTDVDAEPFIRSGYVFLGEYKKRSHIVRYMCAVYTRCNDREYKEYRNYKHLEKVEIEGELRKMFPKIYGQLMKALYLFAQVSDATFISELIKLSRSRDK